MSSPTAALFIIHHSLFIILAILLAFTACTSATAAQTTASTPDPSPTPTLTPTAPPPPPKVTYTPVEPGTVSPVIVQRSPRRGEELPADGAIELVFDRAMDQNAVDTAFSLQTAADQPQQTEGDITWPDERTMQFTPAQPLDRASIYDAILTQDAVAEDGAPLAEPFTFRFSTPGYLEVTQVIPADGTTDVETNATITVMFNRPVVPLTSLEEAEKFPQPLEFEPAISGQGEWLNTSIYVFTPDGDLPGGMTFTVRVKAGLQDVAEKTDLPNDIEWRFTTQPPEVVFTTPNDGQTLVPIENPIKITFSQPVEAQSAQDKFELTAAGSLFGGTVAGQYEVISETLTFTPTEPLEFDTRYNVTIDAGVTGAAGGSGMISPYSFGFTTVPLPRIVGTEPADGDNNAPPQTGFSILFNTPINPATVMDHVEMVPPLPLTPTLVYTSYSPWNNSFNFSFGAQPSTAYQVRISPGIEDPYGNKTTDNLNVRFRTRSLPPNYQLRTPDFVGTYDAALPAKMVVRFVNVNTLNLRLYQLDPEDVLNPWDWNTDRQPDSSRLLREWQERLEAPADKQAFQVIDLSEGGGPLAPGVYLLDTDSPQLNNQNYYAHRHLLVVTEINLTLKAGQRDALVWATDLANGEPVTGQEIVFFDTDNRQQLGSATTDSSGLARLDLGQRPYRTTIIALIDTTDDNFSAVSENWARGISPYEFGLDFAYNLPDYNVHLYTDRPIYRPGQTIHFKGIIRSEDDVQFRRPDVGRVNVSIFDAAYETILEEEVEVSPAGTFNGSVDLEEGAALGNYTIAVNFGDQHFEQYVQVAAYRAPEFEVTVEPSEPELLRGEDVEATIHTNYFFGGPLAGAGVTWNVLAESYRFEPPQLGGYSFTDANDPYVCFDCWWWQPDTFPQPILDGSGTSDAAGQLSLTLDGQELDEILETGSQRLTIEANATGPDNQFISGRNTVIVHKGDYYIGLSPQEQVADANEETAIDLIAVDWDAQRLVDKTLDVQIVRYEWVNTFIEEAGGGYWQSETKKELVDQFTVTTDAQGEAIARFTPPQGGSYQIIAQDDATLTNQPTNQQSNQLANLPTSPIRSSIFVWVAGEDDISWRRENNDRITLISDKAGYEPGETAEILIPSPFEDEHYALVTVERGRIIEQEVIKMTSTSQVYQLPITENYAPNIYVSVVLVQGREGPSADDAPRLADYKVGILPIDVKPSAQLLNISLTASPDQAEPGSEVTYNLEVTDVNNEPVSAEFSLDLVDKAVLSLQPRQPEAIVKAYYDRRALGISTSSGLSVSVNRLLLELAEDLGLDQDDFAQAAPPAEAPVAEMEEAAAEPQALAGAPAPTNVARAEAMVADEALDSAAANKAQIPAGVEVREEFSDTAFWEPVIVTDESGQAEVMLTLPDNLTTWVMRGVGVTNETEVGEATTELVSTMPLLIRPVAPRFLVVDDKAQLAANITNNTDDTIEAEVTLSADGVIIDSATAAVQTIEVPAQGETKVTWDVTAEDVTETELVFAAVSTDGEYSDAAKPRLTTGPDGTLLVYRYTAPDIVGTAGQLTEGGDQTEVVALPPNFDERRGELSIQLDPSLAAGMRDGLDYLEHYEYECTEQTVSRFLPNV
ncbi:MAG: Ig-like domain-containing protein, partial [Anaerolineae bacterium]|nr:Ig-like domain-containing protein [Anaerolineae bacterium]